MLALQFSIRGDLKEVYEHHGAAVVSQPSTISFATKIGSIIPQITRVVFSDKPLQPYRNISPEGLKLGKAETFPAIPAPRRP
jgi:hypothetical protein